MPLVLAVGLLAVLAPTVRADAATAMVTSPDGVNLRAGPGTSFPILAVLPIGTTVSVTGAATSDNWLPVTYNAQSGFVLGDYISTTTGQASSQLAPPPPVPAPTPVPSAAATPAASGSLPAATVTPPDGLNLRAGPATSYNVVIAVPGGSRVQVVGVPTSDGWYSVVYNGKLGWVDGKYLSFSSSPTPPGPATPVAAPAAAGRFVWPVESRQISTMFSAAHPAIDIDQFPNGGDPVVAAATGTVTFAGGDTCCSYGLYVIITHADGYTTLYGHLSSISVQQGQQVAQGTLLGKSGNTGFSTGAHLHFEVRKDGAAVNPLTLLTGPYTIE